MRIINEARENKLPSFRDFLTIYKKHKREPGAKENY